MTVVVTALMVVFAVVMVAPYAFMAVSAFEPQREIFATPLRFFPHQFTFESFSALFSLLPYARWYFNTLLVAVLGTALTLTISSMAGFAFSKYEFRYKSVLFTLVLGTVLVPFQVLLVPQFQAVRLLGGFNSYWALVLPVATITFLAYWNDLFWPLIVTTEPDMSWCSCSSSVTSSKGSRRAPRSSVRRYVGGMAMTERRATDSDVDACVRIVHALPDYFTDDVPAKVRQDLASHGGWVVTDDDAVMGFAVAERRSAAAEIHWIAVDPTRRGSGLGTRLLRRVLADLRGDGVVLVEVKTLDGSVDYAPYGPTRAFWERRGFLQIDTVDPLPGWRPGNPCAFYVAALAATV